MSPSSVIVRSLVPEAKDKLILIVDDDETVLELLKFTVENAGFRAALVNDGDKVIDEVEKNRPDLIILDMMLPGKSGIDLIKDLQVSKYIDIPVITFSGRFKSDFLWKLVQFEPNIKDYLVKPINVDQLVAKIHSILKTK